MAAIFFCIFSIHVFYCLSFLPFLIFSSCFNHYLPFSLSSPISSYSYHSHSTIVGSSSLSLPPFIPTIITFSFTRSSFLSLPFSHDLGLWLCSRHRVVTKQWSSQLLTTLPSSSPPLLLLPLSSSASSQLYLSLSLALYVSLSLSSACSFFSHFSLFPLFHSLRNRYDTSRAL